MLKAIGWAVILLAFAFALVYFQSEYVYPPIVQLHNADELKPLYYLCIGLVVGNSLANWLQSEKRES